MRKNCILNFCNPLITERIMKYGYACIATEKSANVSEPISLHADVLYLNADNKTIYVSDCQKNNISFLEKLGYTVKKIQLDPGYKTECKLNIVITSELIIANPKTSMGVAEIKQSKQVLEVKQGYTKCSTVVLNDDNYITEDINIYNVLNATCKNCLLIKKGYVHLEGYEYGFIGGACAVLEQEKIVLFFGDITKHPDFRKIKAFCLKNNYSIEYIDSMTLTDIGGVVII